MSRAIALVAVTVATAACGAVTPEEEARTFLLALVDCMEENRDAMAASFGNAEALATEQMDEMCDQVDRDALSEEALPLMEDAGKRAFGKAMPTIMGAAMASAFTGGGTGRRHGDRSG